MRRILALLMIVPVLALGACDPEQGHSTHPKKNAGQAQKPPPVDNGAAQPAPVQGDPSAHNTQPGEVDVHVSWTSENKHTPSCEWSKNAPGGGHPCENMTDAHQEGKNYIGLWEYETTGAAGDVFFLAAQGTGAMKSMECSIAWKGHYHEIAGDGKRCSGTYKLE
jgi:hypothetical protein